MRSGFPKWLTNIGVALIVLLPIWMLQYSFQHEAPPPSRNEVIIHQQKAEQKAQKVRFSDPVDTLSAGDSSPSGGREASVPPLRSSSAKNTYVEQQAVVRNIAKGKNSLVAGGKANIAEGDHTTVGGGQQNVASKWETTVSGGSGNQASEIGATVSGGKDNAASGILSVVSGGRFNQATGVISRIGGGANNKALDMGTQVGGGKANTAAGNYASIGGGVSNRTDTGFSAILGGEGNLATGLYSVAAGGLGNQSGGTASTISGGESNVTIDVYTTISGGILNFARGYAATIAGGAGNGVLGDQATVGGGWNNIAFGNYSTIPGGEENVARAANSFAAGQKAQALHAGAYVWADASGNTLKSQQKNEFSARASGGFRLLSDESGSTGVALAPGSGSWSSLSSTSAKQDFEEIDPQNILESIAHLPIQTWQYRSEKDGIRHLGPVAEEFHQAFGLGDSPQRISSVDADGVALAGIQALYKEVESLRASIEQLREENLALKRTLQGINHDHVPSQ